MQTFWKGNTFSMATDLGAPIPNVGCPHNCHLSAPSQGVPCQLEGTVRPWEHISFETNDFPWCGRQALLQGLQWWFTNSILFVVFFFITKVIQACYKQSRHGELYKEKCNSGPIFSSVNCTFCTKTIKEWPFILSLCSLQRPVWMLAHCSPVFEARRDCTTGCTLKLPCIHYSIYHGHPWGQYTCI